jgi:hypothetical protein
MVAEDTKFRSCKRVQKLRKCHQDKTTICVCWLWRQQTKHKWDIMSVPKTMKSVKLRKIFWTTFKCSIGKDFYVTTKKLSELFTGTKSSCLDAHSYEGNVSRSGNQVVSVPLRTDLVAEDTKFRSCKRVQKLWKCHQ